MTNFFRTLSILRRNTFVNPYIASLKHVTWAFRKIFNRFPCDLKVGTVTVRIANLAVANGMGALLNAMGYYDPNNMYLIEEILKKRFTNTFLDIGANIGVYSLIASALSEDIRIFAFEPHPVTFSLLQENVFINHKQNLISCHQVALGDTDGEVLFRDSAGDPENRVLTGNNKDIHSIMVVSRRGDSFCAEHAIHPEVLKIDVEGFESQVLRGFDKSLLDTKLIFVECWDSPKAIEDFCKRFGFVGPYKVDYMNRKLVRENIHLEDWVFIKSQSVSSFCRLLKFELSE